MKRRLICITTLCLLLAGLPAPQRAQRARGGAMTNDRVIELLKRGVAEAEIVEQIRRSSTRFDTSAKALRRLRRVGAGDALMKEILKPADAARATGAEGDGPAPCAQPPGSGEAAAYRPEQGRQPPSRYFQFIKPDDSSTRRLPPAPPEGDGEPSGAGRPLKIGVVRPLAPALTTAEHGKCFRLGAGRAEVLRIVSEGARQVRAHFTAVALPPGATLFVYSDGDAREVYGPYEGEGPSADGSFWSPPVEGDSLVIEYYTPRPSSGGRAAFRVTELSHIF